MARPTKTGSDKREHVVRVRLTLAEKTHLFSLASAAGLTPSDFIRGKTLNATAHIRKATPDRAAFIAALSELGKVGSNVNQIARALNRREDSGELIGVSGETITFTLSGLDDLTAALLKLLEYDGHSR